MTTANIFKVSVNALLAFALGVGLGFLCLELIGMPLLIAVLWIGRYAADRSSASLGPPLLGLGLGFAATIAWFAVRTSGIFDGTAGSGSVYWFGFWFLVGCAMTGVGVSLLIRRFTARPAPSDRPSAG